MMTLSTNGMLAVHRPGRTIILGTVTPASREQALLASGYGPTAARLIVAGVPRMLAQAVQLLDWHDALASNALDHDELDQAARWRMRPRQ